jgi:hypothetical protein
VFILAHRTSGGLGMLRESSRRAGFTGGGATRDWRTPNTRDHHAGGPRLNAKQRQICLVDQADTWGTPRANDAEKRGAIGADPRNGVSGQAVNWGTPRVTTNNGIGCPDSTGKGSRLEDQAAEFADE